jgi:hypothetical protein
MPAAEGQKADELTSIFILFRDKRQRERRLKLGTLSRPQGQRSTRNRANFLSAFVHRVITLLAQTACWILDLSSIRRRR